MRVDTPRRVHENVNFNQMIHPDTELRFISPEIGYGVFATKLIPRGSITWVPDQLDQKFTLAELERLHPMSRQLAEKYSFIDLDGYWVLCWDHGRFMNHSCEANCLSTGFPFEIAVDDIVPGSELTCDYGLLNLQYPLECTCGARECRKQIGRENVFSCSEAWDVWISGAFPLIKTVAQPLWPLLCNPEEVEAAIAGRIPVPSCRVQLFPPLPQTYPVNGNYHLARW